MNDKIITEQKTGRIVAFRFRNEPEAPAKVDLSGAIIPLPEFGAIAFNARLHRIDKITCHTLPKPEVCNDIKCQFRADVMAAGRSIETWFAPSVPPPFKNLAEFVAEFLTNERRALAKLATRKQPPQSIKGPMDDENQVDHKANARAVTMDLLRRDFPQFFRALDNGLSASEIRKAYLADCIARQTPVAPTEGLDTLIQDAGFFRWHAAAMQKPGRKVKPEEWELAVGWIAKGYFGMTDAGLERHLNAATGLSIKGDSWRRKAARLGLINARKLGRPEKPNALPPE